MQFDVMQFERFSFCLINSFDRKRWRAKEVLTFDDEADEMKLIKIEVEIWFLEQKNEMNCAEVDNFDYSTENAISKQINKREDKEEI